MAVVIDATVAGENSNSYVTLDDADDYFAASVNNGDWLAYSAEQRTVALITATRDMEALSWHGEKLTDEQALHFPRKADGEAILPAVAWAQCEQALWRLGKQASPDLVDREALQAQGVTAISLDGVSETYGGSGSGGLAPAAQRLLSWLRKRGARILPRYDRADYESDNVL